MKKQAWISLLLLLLLVVQVEHTAAQGNVSKWARYDVNLAIQQDSGIRVEEVHEVALVSGATTFDRAIPTGRLDSISSVQVLEFGSGGQRTYQQADTQADYTFQIIPSGSEQIVRLYFPPNNAPSTRFVLRYFVIGGLRFYEEGDRFDWRPFGSGAPAPIGSSTITVNLPTAVAPEQLQQESSGVPTENFMPEGNKVQYRAVNIPAGGDLEISLTFPHGIVQGAAPSWQVRADLTPMLQWGSVGLMLLLLCGGPLAALGWWYWRIRPPSAGGKEPKYVKIPPSALSPAVAGVLLDGKSTPRHITATLLDLAGRGALHVYPGRREDELADEESDKPEFNLYGIDQEKAARPYESTLYSKIFGYLGGKKRQLSAIRRTLFMAVPEIKGQIDVEIAKAGYFAEEAKGVRRQYLAFGGAGVIMSIVLGLLVAIAFSGLTSTVGLPCLGTAVTAAAFMGVGYFVSGRTDKGNKEMVRWAAFKRYLADLDVAHAKKVQARFARLLPYAVAFGLEKSFVDKFAAANAPAPNWWSIPEEKLPDIGREGAHDWVSRDVMTQNPQPRPQKTRTKSAIRRLGSQGQGQSAGNSLKQIQPLFVEFLAAAHQVFAKAPPLDEEIDFDSLADDSD